MNYESLVESQGIEVLLSLYMGEYQGDILMLVRNRQGQFGILTAGYGSCSVCDALQACDGDADEYDKLAKNLCGSVIWEEPENIIDYLNNKDWEGSYYGRADGLDDFIKEAKETLMLRYLAGF